MRVAILGQLPIDLSQLTSGVEAAILSLIERLPFAGVDELHVITCARGLHSARTTAVGRAVVHYLPRPNLGRLTWHRREARQIRALVREIQPDIVHAHSTGLYAGAALGCGYPNVITAHGIIARELALYRRWDIRLPVMIDVAYERDCVARAGDIIAISPYVQAEFADYTRARFHLIENAVDPAFFKLPRQPQPGRILFAGSVIERKGVLPLVQALAVVKAALPQVELRVAGSTSADVRYYDTLMRASAGLGVAGDISFVGLLDLPHLLDEYSRCTVFALPSFQETAPVAVEQAMAAGIPVVATPVGGMPHMVSHGETGLIVETGNSTALADALLRLLQDDTLCARMGEQARSQAEERFAPDVVARKTKAVYDQILAAVPDVAVADAFSDIEEGR